MRRILSPAPWIVGAFAVLASGCASVEPIRIATYNIKHGHGMDGAVDLDRVAGVLRALDADVILLQEVDQGCARSGHLDQAAFLGQALGMEARFGPFRPYDGGLYGMAALSRLPILAAEVLELPPGPNPLSALELELDAPGGPFTVVGLHLVMTEEQRLAQARFLTERYRDHAMPLVLAGDLNSERDSSVVQALEALLDLPVKQGEALTFPSVVPVKEIDFVAFAPKGTWSIAEHRVIDERVASDHRPVIVEASPP